MKVVVSIGGSVLSPDSPGRIREHAAVLEGLVGEGCTVAAVVGGGSTALDYISTARELGANEMTLDEIGIAATRLNARLLITALGEKAVLSPAEDYESAGASLRRGEIAVMGGVAPAQTTDAVSAVLAEYVDADLLVFGTSVPGVYSADPAEREDVEHFPTLSADDLVDIITDIQMDAGAGAPVDLLAAKVLQRAGIWSVVVDGTDPSTIGGAIRYGEHDGTVIVPPDEEGAAPTLEDSRT